MERKFSFTPEEFYHVYNRGTDKRAIFLNKEDYLYFQKLLYLCNSKQRIILRDLPKGVSVYEIVREDTFVEIGAYCLMPNHFHLLIYEKEEGGITKFMSKILTAYAMYFNHKYKRTGSLFEGCFKAINVNSDEYLQYLFAYIGLNPIKCIQPNWKKVGIKKIKEARLYLGDYRHSSYQDSIGVKREENLILNIANFPEYFSTTLEFKRFVDEWLTYGRDFNVDGSLYDSTQGSPVY